MVPDPTSTDFIARLTGSTDTPINIRLLDDDSRKAEAEKLPAVKLFGPLREHWPQIVALQSQGYGVYVVVNQGGDTDSAILDDGAVRAQFADFDGKALPDDWEFHATPDVGYSRDDLHHHIYWFITPDMQPACFKQTQRQISDYYGSDPNVCNLSRLMRLPGTLHLKDPIHPRTYALNADVLTYRGSPRTLAHLTLGLRAARQRENSAAGDDPNKLRPASFRKLLSFIEPSLRPCDHEDGGDPNLPSGEGGRNVFVGVMQHIISGDGVRQEPAETWDGEEEACRWADGTRWGERIGDADYRPVNWTYDTDEDCLADVRRSGEPNARILTASLVRLANFNGYAKAGGKLNDDDPKERFAGVVLNIGARPMFDPLAGYKVAPFPMDTIPPILRDCVRFQAGNIGVDPAAVALASLVACSGAIDHGFRLRMKRNGDWYVRPNLWGLLVADPSMKKSPAIRACIKPIEAAEIPIREQYARDYGSWKSLKENAGRGAAVTVVGDEPAPPVRYIVRDTTPEAVAEIQFHQDRGVFNVQDEMGEFISGLERYSSAAAARGFWTRTFDGGGSSVDRKKAGASFFVKNCSTSLLGGIQPAVLDDLADALQGNGMLQRFIPVMMVKPEGGELDLPDEGATAAYEALLTKLLVLPPRDCTLSSEALAVAAELREFLKPLAGTLELGKGFCQFVGKLDGIQGRLMLVLHLAGDPDSAVPPSQIGLAPDNGAAYAAASQVSAATARAAARIIRDFILSHARAFYASATDQDELRRIYSYVLTQDRERFTTSDFQSGIPFMRHMTPWQIFQAVEPLVASGWLQPEQEGVPVRKWIVVLGIREAFAERRAAEIQRKAEIQRIIRSIDDE